MQRPYKRISSDGRVEETTSSGSASTASNHSHLHASTGLESPRSASLPNNKTHVERLSEKLHAAFWVVLSIMTIQYTDTISIIFTSKDIVRPVFNIAVGQLTVNAILMLYLAIYLPKVKGLHDSSAWEVYCPKVIPIMTANGVVCAMFLLRSLWPVWGFLTPFVLSIEFFGLIFVTHFIPWF